MADKKLNEGLGYGQIELNQCAFRRDGRIEAQCKIEGADYVENGMILAIDNTKREVRYPAEGDYMFGLNYTSEHMYDERLVGGLKYYKTDKDSFLPRLGYLAVGDKYTTNTVIYDDAADITTMVYGYVKAGDNGYVRLSATEPTGAIAGAPMLRVIDAKATMPNGAPAVKFQCIKA
jgi:hypothetical protein